MDDTVVVLGFPRFLLVPKAPSDLMIGGSSGPHLQATEREHRVELDPVRRDAGLTVDEVEECDAGHARLRALPNVCARLCHLMTARRSCTRSTRR